MILFEIYYLKYFSGKLLKINRKNNLKFFLSKSYQKNTLEILNY